jgi:hypothetical protein
VTWELLSYFPPFALSINVGLRWFLVDGPCG